jgi:hypothetical protein
LEQIPDKEFLFEQIFFMLAEHVFRRTGIIFVLPERLGCQIFLFINLMSAPFGKGSLALMCSSPFHRIPGHTGS